MLKARKSSTYNFNGFFDNFNFYYIQPVVVKDTILKMMQPYLLSIRWKLPRLKTIAVVNLCYMI